MMITFISFYSVKAFFKCMNHTIRFKEEMKGLAKIRESLPHDFLTAIPQQSPSPNLPGYQAPTH